MPRKPLLAASVTRHARPGGRGAVGVGDARDGAGGILGGGRRRLQASSDGSSGRPGPGPASRGQLSAGVGEAGPGVLRQQPGGGHRVLGQGPQRRPIGAGRGGRGDAAADQHPQAELARLLALEILERTQAPGELRLVALDQEGVGGIGAAAPRGGEGGIEQVVAGHGEM